MTKKLKGRTITGVPHDSGNSKVMTIPRYLIRAGRIDPNKEMTIIAIDKEVLKDNIDVEMELKKSEK